MCDSVGFICLFTASEVTTEGGIEMRLLLLLLLFFTFCLRHCYLPSACMDSVILLVPGQSYKLHDWYVKKPSFFSCIIQLRGLILTCSAEKLFVKTITSLLHYSHSHTSCYSHPLPPVCMAIGRSTEFIAHPVRGHCVRHRFYDMHSCRWSVFKVPVKFLQNPCFTSFTFEHISFI